VTEEKKAMRNSGHFGTFLLLAVGVTASPPEAAQAGDITISGVVQQELGEGRFKPLHNVEIIPYREGAILETALYTKAGKFEFKLPKGSKPFRILVLTGDRKLAAEITTFFSTDEDIKVPIIVRRRVDFNKPIPCALTFEDHIRHLIKELGPDMKKQRKALEKLIEDNSTPEPGDP
jgi:hypothetical protein